jgi:hypothetical protein
MTAALIFLLLLPLLSLPCEARAQEPVLVVKAIGMNRSLSDVWGRPVPKYNIHFEERIEVPDLPQKELFNYSDLLMSGIKSLLLEGKNYPHYESAIVPYGVFALGNYSKYYGNEQLLRCANELFLPDQGLLQKLYNWILPFYRTAFQKLSYTEQRKLLSRIDLCEAYLQYVVDFGRPDLYQQWLDGHEWDDDEKARGFLQRRLDKGQWTRKDCQYWLQALRRDFEPLLKNPHIPASHYLLMEQVAEDVQIVVDGMGRYYLTDLQYHKKHDQGFRLLRSACEEDAGCDYVVAVSPGTHPDTRFMHVHTGSFLVGLEWEE